MWYVPFEVLQVEVNGKPRPLIDRFRIRYAPTMSLAVQQDRPSGDAAGTETYVALGRLFPRNEEGATRRAFERIASSVPRTVEFPSSPLPAPSSLLVPLVTNLIVLDDILAVGGRCLWLVSDSDRTRSSREHARRLVLVALWRSERGDASRFSHGLGGHARIGAVLVLPGMKSFLRYVVSWGMGPGRFC